MYARNQTRLMRQMKSMSILFLNGNSDEDFNKQLLRGWLGAESQTAPNR